MEEFVFPTASWFIQQSPSALFKNSTDIGESLAGNIASQSTRYPESGIPSLSPSRRSASGEGVKGGEFSRRTRKCTSAATAPPRRAFQHRRPQPQRPIKTPKKKRLPSVQVVEPYLNPAVMEYLEKWRYTRCPYAEDDVTAHASDGCDRKAKKVKNRTAVFLTSTQRQEDVQRADLPPLMRLWDNVGPLDAVELTLQPQPEGSIGSVESSSMDGELLPNIDYFLHSPVPKTHPWQESGATLETIDDVFNYNL